MALDVVVYSKSKGIECNGPQQNKWQWMRWSTVEEIALNVVVYSRRKIPLDAVVYSKLMALDVVVYSKRNGIGCGGLQQKLA